LPDRIRPDKIRPDKIKQAGKIIRNQGIVIFPAQCLYGLAANALDPKAIQKVFDLKQRPQSNPILVLIQAPEDLKNFVKKVPDSARILMEKFWPGNLTLVFEATEKVSPQLTALTGKIGIRIPSHPVARALVQQAQGPITGTSANLSGQPGCDQVCNLPPTILQGADMILDAGPLKGGAGSTIVDVTSDPVQILRQGIIAQTDIFQTLSRQR
jgi:L-threonylcarbamoyladenylate synthase